MSEISRSAKTTMGIKHRHFAFVSKAWFPFRLFVPFVARFGFLLLFIAFLCPLLLFLVCH